MAGPENKDKTDTEVVVEPDKKKIRHLGMSDFYRNRELATMLHDVDCRWSPLDQTCGQMHCEWDYEHQEDRPWAEGVHEHYFSIAEQFTEQCGADKYYLEDLVRLWQKNRELAELISITTLSLCKNSGIEP